MENCQVSLNRPSVNEFNALRAKVQWQALPQECVDHGLKNTLFCVSLRDQVRQQDLLAFGRVIGDGSIYFYVQDVMVDPAYQGQGLGAIIMQNIEAYLDDAAQAGATVALLAAKGKEAFYQQYGYQQRTGNPLGLGMCKFI